MTTYYVGPGGSDAAAGTSWALRKLTLSGAEAIPVAAGDTVIVGPGTYRETLTTGVSGSSGSPITYVGDWTGQATDGIGGICRITGSDDDATLTRGNGITGTNTFRTFRGFEIDMTSGSSISASGSDWTVEDCILQANAGNGISAGLGSNWVVRRCIIFAKQQNSGISFSNGTTAAANATVENCIINGYQGIRSDRVSAITVNHCLIWGCNYCLRVGTALAASAVITVTNCLLAYSNIVFGQTATGFFSEDYNAYFGSASHSSSAQTPGAHDNTNPIPFDFGMFLSGYKTPGPRFGELMPFIYAARQVGSGMASEDLYGITRPATDSKKSWGPVQVDAGERSATQAHGGTYALKMADSNRTQFIVPVSNVSTTFSVYVYREANYAGTNPQLVVKQPGQADTTVTDAAAAGQWNQLTTTLTPAAGTKFVTVELVSNNTATTGSFAVYFDDLAVN